MLVQKPPMGWNPWNTFGTEISDRLLREIADRLVSGGFLAAGYEYLVIDDGWSLKSRGSCGELVPDPEKFPSGLKSTVNYIHSKGLKFGIYSCAGVRTCANYPGSYDHEYQDARDFAAWGVDYLKYDFCNFPFTADNRTRYLTMSMALRSTGRDIVFSACNWGRGEPDGWMRSVGAHLYRSDCDINDSWESVKGIIIRQKDRFLHSGPGCYNDIDMLTVGMYGGGNVGMKENLCTFEEYKTQFLFWCLFGSPLMLGADIRSLDADCHALLTNPRLIAVNQDSDGRTPFPVLTEPYNEQCFSNTHIYAKQLADGSIAVGLFNLRDTRARFHCLFADMGVPYYSGTAFELTDLFTGENLGLFRDEYGTVLEGHASQLLLAKWVRTDG